MVSEILPSYAELFVSQIFNYLMKLFSTPHFNLLITTT